MGTDTRPGRVARFAIRRGETLFRIASRLEQWAGRLQSWGDGEVTIRGCLRARYAPEFDWSGFGRTRGGPWRPASPIYGFSMLDEMTTPGAADLAVRVAASMELLATPPGEFPVDGWDRWREWWPHRRPVELPVFSVPRGGIAYKLDRWPGWS